MILRPEPKETNGTADAMSIAGTGREGGVQ